MYIKQIIIQGFKSYKDQTVIEPFSPKHNVIVGRNGSGKSNFFAAIRFVLSDAYTQMGREERQALLHEGSGSAVMSAYVEVIFDNSDERFPTGKEELVLRRTIGHKKDEYSLDRKNATKADVMSLLESAGFSRSNPYYIVPQGRVTALTNMKDPERLNLLKEVAGTQVYEARRSESIRIMADTDFKRAQIDDVLTTINERLAELEGEKKELKEYQEKDREKRCLEYTIYRREQEELLKSLEEVEEQRAAVLDDSDTYQAQFLEGETQLEEIDNSIRASRQRIELLKVDRKQYEDERKESARTRAKLELEVKNTTEGQASAQTTKARYDADLEEVQAAIRTRELSLAAILPAYEDALEKENAVRRQAEEAESARSRLYAKQGRNSQFKSKNERDAWLQRESGDVNVALATRKAVLMQTTEDIAELESDMKQLESAITEARQKLDTRGESGQSMLTAVQEAKDVRNRLQDQRKELWREEAKLDTIIRNTQTELDRSERFLSHMMDQNTSRGIAAVRRISRQRNLTGVYGTLAELFQVSDRYRTAAEVTAGNSLFHYVVDNDATATEVLEILQKERAGRVTFMPLNRLHPRPTNMPKSSDAIELISKLTFDPKYEKALQQVFGKTVICPNLQIASQYARSHGVSAITPEGDRSDKKGALSGGFVDPRQSRIEAVQALSKLRNDSDSHRARGEELRREIESLDQEITRAVGELQKVEQKRTQSENSFEPLQQELRSRLLDLQSKEDGIAKKKKTKTQIEANIGELGAQQSAYESELASAFKKNLSADEEQQLEGFSITIPALKKEIFALSETRADLEVQKSTIEVELRENLTPRLDQLKGRNFEDGSVDDGSRLKERQAELKRVTKALDGVDRKLQDAEKAAEKANTELTGLEKRKAETQHSQEELAKTIERSHRHLSKRASKRQLIVEKNIEVSRNIRNLGVLPEEAFHGYDAMSSSKAVKKLHAANEVLKKYTNVNKKAFEQYNNFTKQRETLTKRRSELDTSQKSIRELIEVLDQRKDEAIERTFKQVSKEFANIFERLVPAGRGRLVIQRKSDRTAAAPTAQDDDEDEPSDAEAARNSVENYTGVGIAVSFNSKHDEQQRIAQLSGGQKSLCALALVFAIQQCDPAPFYLFDEIDANLDAQYRTAVAALLQQISSNGQFICTTFRPEMVLVAEKCYGVAYSNKTSSIDVVNREEALEFVEGQVSGV